MCKRKKKIDILKVIPVAQKWDENPISKGASCQVDIVSKEDWKSMGHTKPTGWLISPSQMYYWNENNILGDWNVEEEKHNLRRTE